MGVIVLDAMHLLIRNICFGYDSFLAEIKEITKLS
jgi:hypothetical protein